MDVLVEEMGILGLWFTIEPMVNHLTLTEVMVIAHAAR